MERINLWENLKPLSLSDLKKDNCDSILSDLLRTIAEDSLTLSTIIDTDLKYSEQIRRLYFNIYKVISLTTDQETDFINNLPSSEKEVFKKLRNTMSHLMISSEIQKTKTPIHLLGNDSIYSSITRGF